MDTNAAPGGTSNDGLKLRPRPFRELTVDHGKLSRFKRGNALLLGGYFSEMSPGLSDCYCLDKNLPYPRVDPS